MRDASVAYPTKMESERDDLRGTTARLGDFAESRKRLPGTMSLISGSIRSGAAAKPTASRSSCDMPTISWWVSAQAGRGALSGRREGAVS